MSNDDVPDPGSNEAIEQGCTCPTLENEHGQGVKGNGELFYKSEACPLHGRETIAGP